MDFLFIGYFVEFLSLGPARIHRAAIAQSRGNTESRQDPAIHHDPRHEYQQNESKFFQTHRIGLL